LSLFDYIKSFCNIDDEIEIDLCDLTGEMKHLQENLNMFANSILKEKEKYILVRVERKFFCDLWSLKV
jgi:hypothetical protein